MRFNAAVSGIALLSGMAAAHPGHDLKAELAERATYLANAKRVDLSHCASQLKERGVEARNIARRAATAKAFQTKRKRDLATVLATSHNETTLNYTPLTDDATLFTGNASCSLTPEVTQGPYYVAGEYVRRNVTEEQVGVPVVLDYQIIDVTTCQPVPDVYLEIWHANATGVYSGIVAAGNGNDNITSNYNTTFLRGVQTTDADGVAQFDSIFPGHYTTRAVHIHLMVHQNATLLPNGTLATGSIYSQHIGQAFFDQSLISDVELNSPYNTNTQVLTTNAEDSIMAQEADAGVDPVMDYTYLGNSAADGLFLWMSFGINTTAASTVVQPAAYYYETGGVVGHPFNYTRRDAEELA